MSEALEVSFEDYHQYPSGEVMPYRKAIPLVLALLFLFTGCPADGPQPDDPLVGAASRGEIDQVSAGRQEQGNSPKANNRDDGEPRTSDSRRN